jgi:NitT/TauT family transport system ATP-binding protein
VGVQPDDAKEKPELERRLENVERKLDQILKDLKERFAVGRICLVADRGLISEKNIELVDELRGVPKAERRQRAKEALDLVGLTGFEKQFPRQLSGGMRMRVSLARSLVAEPDLALFDEPFGALDEITRLRMQTELQGIFQLKQFAGLFITHSVFEAVYLSTRVLVMSGQPGRIVADLTVPWGYPRPPGLRHEPEFAALTGQVSAALEGGHS